MSKRCLRTTNMSSILSMWILRIESRIFLTVSSRKITIASLFDVGSTSCIGSPCIATRIGTTISFSEWSMFYSIVISMRTMTSTTFICGPCKIHTTILWISSIYHRPTELIRLVPNLLKHCQ